MKPLLLLDVDGVLLLRQQTKHARQRVANIGYATWFDPQQAERLWELDRLFELQWCTGWGHAANQIVAPLFGLERLPVIELAMPQGWVPRRFYTDEDGEAARMNHRMNWKLSAVDEYLTLHHDPYRPVAWLDDQIGQTDVKRWAQARPNTKLVQTFEHEGLGFREMKMLREFAYPHIVRSRFAK